MLRSCGATAMELAANKSKTVSKSGTIQAFIKDIFVQCVRPRRLVIFYLSAPHINALTYLLTDNSHQGIMPHSMGRGHNKILSVHHVTITAHNRHQKIVKVLQRILGRSRSPIPNNVVVANL